ncbi:hypothetical protein M9Y10_008717 [Tritrichomonas musculus]|uniref:Surface antigen BspA-like n=1 Tax=Tritrichomonas musculus TaxID=1915356 RepID=A0ABR2IZ43_9EUKA
MTVELQNGVVIKINDENTEGIIAESPNARDNIFIPRFVENKGKKVPITTISNRAFVDNEYVNSIVFADDSDLQVIRKGAFSHSSLEKLSIPAKVSNIEDGFCSGAKNLFHVEVSSQNKNFVSINNEFLVRQGDDTQKVLLFARRNIENASIPNIVSKIGQYSFDFCQNLKSVTFTGSNVTELCNFAFNECSNLEEIALPSSIVQIGERCFNACKKLKTITIPKDSKLQKICKLAFFHTPIEKIFIPSSTEELVDGFCSGAPNLNLIEVCPNNKKYASFNGDYLTTKEESNGTELIFVRRNIETFSIPSTINKIGVYAFQTCHKLTTVTFSSKSIIDAIDDHSFSECVSLERIEIPSNVIKRVGKFAFSSCKNLKNVTFLCPQGFSVLEVIDDNAFSGCESLTEIAIPSSVKIMGASCFHTCTKLKVVKIESEKLETIGKYAFSYCQSLTEVSIPCEVSCIGEFAFESCTSLKTVVFKKFGEGEKKVNLEKISKFAFSYCSSLESFIVPCAVKSIGQGAFKSCKNLKEISFTSPVLNSQLEEIGIEAFDGCCSLVHFEAPPSLRQIHGSAFRSCTSLSSFTFSPKSTIEMIGKSAFNNCTSLTKFILPSSVKKLGESAFDSCEKLSEVTIEENSELQFIGSFVFSKTPIEKLFIPSKVDQIEEGFCFNATKLNRIDLSKANERYVLIGDEGDFLMTKNKGDLSIIFARKNIEKVEIPPDVKRIGKYAFSNCVQMKSLSLRSNEKCQLEVIDDFAFAFCDSIVNVSIPNTVKMIGKSSFSSCANLKTVTFEEPPKIEQLEFNSFENCPKLEQFEKPNSIKKLSKNISDFFNIDTTPI